MAGGNDGPGEEIVTRERNRDFFLGGMPGENIRKEKKKTDRTKQNKPKRKQQQKTDANRGPAGVTLRPPPFYMDALRSDPSTWMH